MSREPSVASDLFDAPLGRWFRAEYLRRTIRFRAGEGSVMLRDNRIVATHATHRS